MKYFTVRTARQRLRMSQVDLALATGLDQTTISDYEVGKNTNPRLRSVLRLAKALKLKPIQLRFPDQTTVRRNGRAA